MTSPTSSHRPNHKYGKGTMKVANDVSALQSILYEKAENVKVDVLSFPGEYCGSIAIGCFNYNHQTVFCKDRDRAEAIVQQAGSKFGKYFASNFYINANESVVAYCESLERPKLEDLPIKSAGAKLWQLKETQWQDIFKEEVNDGTSCVDDCHDDDDESSASSSTSQSPPSKKDCWLLEEAVRFYNPTFKIEDSNMSSVDSSLRRKLRMAADRSVSGSLDMVTLFMLTEVSQKYVQGPKPEWPDYVDAHKLNEPKLHLALTADETKLLFQDKLVGPDIQIAMLYTIVTGLPDCHCGNMAIQEVDCPATTISTTSSSSWRLRIVHFDTGLTSVRAGVSLNLLQLAYNEDEDGVDYGIGFDFEGGPDGIAYYFPVIFSSIFATASESPMDSIVRRNLLDMDGNDLDRIAQQEFKNSETFDVELHQQIGKIMQCRLNKMKKYAKEYPNCSCLDLAFATISAWKRDYQTNEEHEEWVKWLREVKEWAGVSN